MKLKYIIAFGLVLINFQILYSQQQENTPPLELPNFIIEGKEQLNVQAGIKQYPEKVNPLSKAELDSLNSLDKQLSLLTQPRAMVNQINDLYRRSGYIRGEFGRYTTPKINAAYNLKSGDYFFFGAGSYEMSQGHIDNADYSKLNLNLQSEYIAPEKYWIFGGSKTKAGISFDNASYSLFAIDTGADRKRRKFSLNIDSDGEYNGYSFSTGASYKSFELDNASDDASDNALNGYLKIQTRYDQFRVGIDAEMDMHTIRGNGANYFSAEAFLKYELNNAVNLKFTGGLQSAGSSEKNQRGNVNLRADVDYRINEKLTLRASIESAFEKLSLMDESYYNPYISRNVNIDYPLNRNITGVIYYHPLKNIEVNAGIKIARIERMPVYISMEDAQFDLKYSTATAFQLFSNGIYDLTSNDKIVWDLKINSVHLVDTNKSATYVPVLQLGAVYGRNWTDKFGTEFGLTYVGKRYADIDNKVDINSYINLNIMADYKISNDISVFGKIDNLLNQEIYVWDKYKERSIFISAGIMWKL